MSSALHSCAVAKMIASAVPNFKAILMSAALSDIALVSSTILVREI
jgi:hypothetical protein